MRGFYRMIGRILVRVLCVLLSRRGGRSVGRSWEHPIRLICGRYCNTWVRPAANVQFSIAEYAYLASYSRFLIPHSLYGCPNRVFLRFPLYVQTNAGIWVYLRQDHDSSLTHPFQSIDHRENRPFVVWGTDTVVKLNMNTAYMEHICRASSIPECLFHAFCV